LPLLCERHTTSKIRGFEDLAACSTFGFRGEALSSMSFVSHLSVTTMPAGAPCALHAEYADGVLVGPAKATAGVPGTTVAVADLFYNVVTRRKALRGASEEYARVLDVVQRYALLRTEVAFTVRKQGAPRHDLHVSPSSGIVDRVRAVFGADLARSLVPFAAEAGQGGNADSDRPCFRCDGFASGPAHSVKRSTFILFINGRLVDCGLLRRALEGAASAVLPRDASAWLFVAITMPASHVDVNIHPTKAEVAFLHADQLAAAAAVSLQQALESANGERAFVPGAATQPAPGGGGGGGAPVPPMQGTQQRLVFSQGGATQQQPQLQPGDEPAGTQRERAGGDHKLVRTDAKAGKLDAFVRRVGGRGQLMLGRTDGDAARPPGDDDDSDVDMAAADEDEEDAAMDAVRAEVRARRAADPHQPPAPTAGWPVPRAPSPPPCDLTSVCELLAECDDGAHAGLTDVFRRHTYVGLAHPRLALLQHGTRLYIVHVPRVSTALMRQLVLRRFGRHEAISVVPPAPVVPLLLDAVRADAESTAAGSVPDDGAAETLGQVLLEMGPMLQEYFALHIIADPDIEGGIALRTLPELVPGHTPDANALPELLLRLANQTCWTEEKPCFSDVADHLARCYAWRAHAGAAEQEAARHAWSVENVLFPALRSHFRPPAAFATDGTVLQVACLEQLYRVFERC
jgi:DNA mismatch repair protein MLH1